MSRRSWVQRSGSSDFPEAADRVRLPSATFQPPRSGPGLAHRALWPARGPGRSEDDEVAAGTRDRGASSRGTSRGATVAFHSRPPPPQSEKRRPARRPRWPLVLSSCCLAPQPACPPLLRQPPRPRRTSRAPAEGTSRCSAPFSAGRDDWGSWISRFIYPYPSFLGMVQPNES